MFTLPSTHLEQCLSIAIDTFLISSSIDTMADVQSLG